MIKYWHTIFEHFDEMLSRKKFASLLMTYIFFFFDWIQDSNRARRSSFPAPELLFVAVVDVEVPDDALPVLPPPLNSGVSRYDRSSIGSTTLSGNSYVGEKSKIFYLE